MNSLVCFQSANFQMMWRGDQIAVQLLSVTTTISIKVKKNVTHLHNIINDIRQTLKIYTHLIAYRFHPWHRKKEMQCWGSSPNSGSEHIDWILKPYYGYHNRIETITPWIEWGIHVKRYVCQLFFLNGIECSHQIQLDLLSICLLFFFQEGTPSCIPHESAKGFPDAWYLVSPERMYLLKSIVPWTFAIVVSVLCRVSYVLLVFGWFLEPKRGCRIFEHSLFALPYFGIFDQRRYLSRNVWISASTNWARSWGDPLLRRCLFTASYEMSHCPS